MREIKKARLEDIYVGRNIIEKSHKHGTVEYRILSMPYYENGCVWVDVQYIEPLGKDTFVTTYISLMDAGIIPNTYNDWETFIIA